MGNTWEKPVNLTAPVNTIYDDVAFTVSRKDGNSAFYTTKIKSGRRSIQLKRVTINNNQINNKLASLSDILTGKIMPGEDKTDIKTTAVSEAATVIPAKKEAEADVVKKKTEVKANQEMISGNVKKELNPASAAPSQVKPAGSKADPVKAVTPGTAQKKDIVVYRVQIRASTTPRGRYKITFKGKIYNTFEYFYSGGYRTCIGEFKTLSSAKDFQNTLRKSGYPNAFVVAFKNNIRSLDQALFK